MPTSTTAALPSPVSTPVEPIRTEPIAEPPPTQSASASDTQPYPVATPEPADPTTIASYPEPIATATADVSPPTPTQPAKPTQAVFIPVITVGEEPIPTATATPPPTATPTATPTPIPTVDFAAVAADLAAQGQALSPNKIGFHIGVGGNRDGLGEWMQRLDEAGVPFFLKTVSDAGPVFEAQEMIKASGVPHTLVFRHSGDAYDVPDYSLPPAEAARQHWALHMAVWPPELDPNYVWLETINEVDKNESEWLAAFALETAALAERDGFKWAAFGWSSGEPEPVQWEGAQMMAFLRLVASRPDRLAIALHEYSYTTADIADGFPFKVGRFQQLYEVTDRYGLARPTVLITEWGWEYQDIPPVEQAMADIAWAEELYAPYPEVKGAAIWYLGPGFGHVADQTQRLIRPVMIEGLTTYQVREE